MPNRIRQLFAVLAVLAAGMLMFFILLKTRPTVATVETNRAIPLISTIPLHSEDTQVTVEAWGSVSALHRFPIKTRVAGEVIWLHPGFDRGGWIQKNDLIARINPRDYELRLENARAQLALRQSASQRVLQEEANLTATHAIEKKNYDLAMKELARFEELLHRRTISRQAYDNVLLASQKSRTALQNLENQLAVTAILREQEKTNQQLARIAVEQAELDLSRTEIRSPLSGRFADRQIDLQQYLAAGALLGTIIDLEHLQVEVELAVKDFNWLYPDGLDSAGTPPTAAVELADAPDTRSFEGRVTRAAESLDPATRTRAVFVELTQDCAGGKATPLIPGRFCRISFSGKSRTQAFRIPFVAMNGGQIQLIRGEELVVADAKIIQNRGDQLLIQGDFHSEDQLVAVWNETLSTGDKVQSALTKATAQ